MSAFLEFLATNELIIIVSLMIVVFLLVMTIIIMDILSKKKNNISIEEDYDNDIDDLDRTNLDINSEGLGMVADKSALEGMDVEAITKNLERTAEIEEIKYVEEDEETEKTKALLELEILKKELAKMEQEDYIESTPIGNEVVKKEAKEEIITTDEEILPVENNEVLEEKVEEQPIEIESKPLEEAKIPTMEDEVTAFENAQEENAIISVEELVKASENITDKEIEQYEDDGNEPISIKELEALYKSVDEPVEEDKIEKVEVYEETIKLPDFDIKVKPTSEAYEGKSFKNAPVISPVYGLKTTEESIMLEQTANLDKLNEEIKKTNEFLSALKELRKNLE